MSKSITFSLSSLERNKSFEHWRANYATSFHSEFGKAYETSSLWVDVGGKCYLVFKKETTTHVDKEA